MPYPEDFEELSRLLSANGYDRQPAFKEWVFHKKPELASLDLARLDAEWSRDHRAHIAHLFRGTAFGHEFRAYVARSPRDPRTITRRELFQMHADWQDIENDVRIAEEKQRAAAGKSTALTRSLVDQGRTRAGNAYAALMRAGLNQPAEADDGHTTTAPGRVKPRSHSEAWKDAAQRLLNDTQRKPKTARAVSPEYERLLLDGLRPHQRAVLPAHGDDNDETP